MNNELVANKLNAPTAQERLKALKQIKASMAKRPKGEGYTNNHVHSTYSFSPYSPSRIVYEAYSAGLATVGIMDHDSIAGAKEIIEAGQIMGIATTVGFEVRTDWSNTPFGDIRINNPDQDGCGYMCIHGVPHQSIDRADAFLSRIREARNRRNIKMVSNINAIIDDIDLSFEDDIVPISCADDGGSITERHILYALGIRITQKHGRGDSIKRYLEEKLGISLSDTQRTFLDNEQNDLYYYDLLNILKSSFVKRIYEKAEYGEILPVDEVIAFAHEIGAIPAYAYLGDVGNSVTGDKKAQKFEDDYIDELMAFNKEAGFDAIAYMPSRNTIEQLDRVKDLCKKYDFFQISGEDINQPRQSFICRQLMDEEYSHLIDSTWALVGHEVRASIDIDRGLFAGENRDKKLSEKIDDFVDFGASTQPKQ